MLCGGPPNPEVSFAVLPLLGGIALGLGAAVGIWGAYKADKRAKEAMALQKKQEAERKASIERYFGPPKRGKRRSDSRRGTTALVIHE